ncbi:MAG: hypothetical protein KKA54_03040 [Proteobacteria bacterium]|nr:hypothetical protein [Pseudomonadota bacterium]MBU0965337.1 hypothetical protein [Pseudomonadota bacterium]
MYEIHGDRLVILVVKIGHRKDIYKNLPYFFPFRFRLSIPPLPIPAL